MKTNFQRRHDITHILIRHARITNEDGHYLGCLCGHPCARLDHYKHLAHLIDDLITNTRGAIAP